MKPKVSSGYLTPQSSKKKDMSKKSTSGSMENINGACEINDHVFQALMSDPIKRELILNIITSEKDKIDAYKKTLEKKNQSSPFHKALRKPYESPTALHRRRVLEQQSSAQSSDNSESGSSRSTSRQSRTSTVPSPVCFDKILDGVVAFVEVKSGSRDRSEAVRSHLRCMGAVVREKFTKDVTHVIFKDGLFTTYQKASLMNIHLVSVLWLEACKTNRIKIPEKKYPAIGTSVFDHNVSTLCSQMQKDYEELIHEEFQRSIQTGTPLPSAKSLIGRRRKLMTPNSMEVANITKRAQKAGPSTTYNMSQDMMFDDDSDICPLIDGDIIESNSEIFEDFSTRKSAPGFAIQSTNKSKFLQTKNSTEDMELTNVQEEELLSTSKENLSPNIYSKKTPKMNSKVKDSSNIQSLDFIDEDLYRRRTKHLNVSNTEDTTDRLTSIGAHIYNKNKLTPKNAHTELTPRSLYIFSKNMGCRTVDATNKEKPVDVSDSSITNMSILKLQEKSTSTAMSSLRISENSNKNIDGAKNSLGSIKSKLSFSPIQSNIINNILGNLQDISNTTEGSPHQDKKNSDSYYETCKSSEDLNLETPRNKSKNISLQHVTLRKKYVKTVIRTLEGTCSTCPETTEDEDTGAIQKDKKQRRRTTLNMKIDETHDNRLKRNTTAHLTDKEENENIENAAGTVILRQNKILSQKFDDSIEINLNEENTPKKLTADSLNINENNLVKDLYAEIKSNEDSTVQSPKKRNTLQNKRHTGGQSTSLQKKIEADDNHYKETENVRKKYNTRHTKINFNNIENRTTDNSPTASASTRRKTEKNSPAKKLKLTPPEERNEVITNNSSIKSRRQTISSSVLNRGSKKQIIRCKSSTDLDANEDVTSPNYQGKKKFRKLYTPTDFRELIVNDEKEREEKRKVKKKSKSGVFIKPIIRSKKENENMEIVIIPTEETKKTTTNTKNNKQYNSDDDEQVELKNDILNKKNKVRDETPKRTKEKTTPVSSKKLSKMPSPKMSLTTPRVPKTPRQSKRIFSVKMTPITSSQKRRSTLEFQPLTQSVKRRLKIDAVKKPSMVCTKMHKSDVQVFSQIVKKIGGFEVEDEVSEKTTHLIAGESKRTINMLRALAMGCWILKKEWLFRSLESGKWLPEEDFEDIEFSPAVQKNRLQRQAFGPSFSMDIFQDYGRIYVAKTSIPRCSDLRELIQMCKGKITTIPRSASIVIGAYVKYEGVTCVNETWILDCISHNKKYPFKKYLLDKSVL